MSHASSEVVCKQLQTLFQVGTVGVLTDGHLLERFIAGDGSAPAAFAALVERHGPTVLAVCRAILGDPHAAEDAAQATFLILAQRAGRIWRKDSVASWLFGVARQVALRSRRDEATRKRIERRAAEMAARLIDSHSSIEGGAEAFDELDRLPENLRAPVVLCILEGYTHEQAARLLRWPLRSLERRLARAKARLRERLARRGLQAYGGAIAVCPLSAMSRKWADATVRAALSAAGKTGGGIAAAAVITLCEQVPKAMYLAELKLGAAVALSLLCVCGIVVALVVPMTSRPAPAPSASKEKPGTTTPTQLSPAQEPAAAPPASRPNDGRRRLRGIVRDASGQRAAAAWVGGNIWHQEDTWRPISPPDALRRRADVTDGERAQTQGATGPRARFELRDAHGNWQPVSPREIRPARSRPRDFDHLDGQLSQAEFVKRFAPFEVRSDGGWWVAELSKTTPAVRTDAAGRFDVELPSEPDRRLVIASRDFSQMAVVTLQREADDPLDVRLRPARTVIASLIEDPVAGPRPIVTWAAYSIAPDGSWGPRGPDGFIWEEGSSTEPRWLMALLPPGHYRLEFLGPELHRVAEIDVPEGSGSLELPEIGLPRLASAQMIGKPAAEIETVSLDGKPVNLADFRGKVVVLDFWGAWCGPCIVSMPRLAALQETFRGQPLAILALHDASVKSAEEYRKATAKVQAKYWGGRDLPFAVLLDRPSDGQTSNPARAAGVSPRSGRTHQIYEVSAWPSTFLIDRDGKMVGRFEVENLESALRAQFGLSASKDVPQPTPTPAPTPARRPHVFRGRVVGADGRPAPGATVTYTVSEANQPHGPFAVGEKAVTTGADGWFTLTANDSGARFAITVQAAGSAPRAFSSVAAAETPQDLTLKRGVMITGRVIHGRAPVPDAIVALGLFASLRREARTDEQGRFRIPNIPADAAHELSVTPKSLHGRGAVPPRLLRTGADGSTVDIGDLEVQPGHTIKGRVVFSDGSKTPAGSLFSLWIGGNLLEVPVDANGRFELRGVPSGEAEVYVLFPGRRWSPDGYRTSALNKCLNPLNQRRLKGQVNRDITDLILLYERGELLPQDLNPQALDRFEQAKAGPLTGAAQSDIDALTQTSRSKP